MKRIFSLVLAIGLAPLASNAQTAYGWYGYGPALEEWDFEPDYFRTHIFPDSTVQVEYSSGMGYVWMHALGQVFDPTTIYYDGGITEAIDASEAYRVDSIGFPYRYFRPQSDFPDTLIVQFFREHDFDDLYVQPWPDEPGFDDRSYARLAYDSTLRRHPDPTMEIVKILTDADTAPDVQYMTFEIGSPIPPGQICGAVITYLPGNPYNFGDTLDSDVIPPPVNRINDFITNYYVDNELIYETDIYNHGIIATASGRYGDNSNGWAEQYWPGMASGGGIYHAAISFHLSPFVGVEEEGELVTAQVFPNPTNDNSTLVWDSKTQFDVQMEVLSITGETVIAQRQLSANIGANKTELPTADLVPGIYLVRMFNGEFAKTIRLTKQ